MTSMIQLWPSIYSKNPDHPFFLEEATLISTVNGLPQSFKEAIKVKKYIYKTEI